MNSHSLDLVSSFVFAFELSVSCGFYLYTSLASVVVSFAKKNNNKQTQAAAIEFNLEFFFK